MATAGFFDRTPPSLAKHSPGPNPIEIGGYQFQALAIAMMDNLKESTKAQEPLVKAVLAHFFYYYPHTKPSQSYLTPAERMQLILGSAKKSEMVACMAYVLRQIALDELWAKPLLYREAFNDIEPSMTKGELAEARQNLSPLVLKALANALNIDIILSIVEPQKELPLRISYKTSSESPLLSMQLQLEGENYKPAVKRKADFMHINPVVRQIEPTKTNHSHEKLSEILPQIAADNTRLYNTYKQASTQLMNWVSKGQLDKQSLMDLYIQFLPRDAQIDAVGSPLFFLALEQAKKDNSIFSSGPINIENDIVKQMVDTLSGWVSIQKIDADALFKAIEIKQLDAPTSNSMSFSW